MGEARYFVEFSLTIFNSLPKDVDQLYSHFHQSQIIRSMLR